MTDARDNRIFGHDAGAYRARRPSYPDALFDWLAQIAPARELAWDCGTGTGQAAQKLARSFRHVRATDADARLLAQATRAPNIDYAQFSAEENIDLNAQVDLITCACSVHWFDLDLFYVQARRALKPDGVIGLWTYDWPWTSSQAVNAVLEKLKTDILGAYWGPVSVYYFGQYKNLPFPFIEIEAPAFHVEVAQTSDELLDFLGTWSAPTKYRNATGVDPLALVREELSETWRTELIGPLQVPLHLRVGRKRKI